LAIPAGALADILDKRRYLILLQAWMMIVAAILAIVSFMGKTTPQLLLFLTFCLSAGTALNAPTWQSIVSELVPSKNLVSAITLNSMGVNFSRTIGPAIAGLIIATLGPPAVFAINAVSFLGIIIALNCWKRDQPISTLPTERFIGAMRSGVRYVKGSPVLIKVLIKSGAIFVFISAIWALLPLIARNMLHQGPTGYGILLAMLGLGAVTGALTIQKIRNVFNLDKLIMSGSLIFAISMLTIPLFVNFYYTCGMVYLIGIAWLSVLSTLNAVVQQSVPSWVRARAISVYLMFFFGGMALGGVLWGFVTAHFTIAVALVSASVGLIFANMITYHWVLEGSLIYDHTPSMDLPAPSVEKELSHDEGPVMITVEYDVNPEDVAKFLLAIQDLRLTRLREGSFYWSIFNDIEQPKRFVECFMVESWLEHLRFHERVSISDRKIQAAVNLYHKGPARPQAIHYVACELPRHRNK
jgi:MFS family permease